ncbi:MAG: cell division protein FtsA [Chloroflexi bacterium]|nr:cell division protein FtsA [Chloroflexota bacterium]
MRGGNTARESSFAAVDVGSSKVCVLIGELDDEGALHVLGVGMVPSRGLRKGVVVNVEDTVESIGIALDKATRLAGHGPGAVYVSVGGPHLASLNNRGLVAVGHSDRPIADEDVQRVLDAARMITVPNTREILHVVPRGYTVDGQDGVRSPIGMLGHRLDVEAHLITGGTSSVQNLLHCLQRAGVEVQELVVGSLAAAEAVLTDEERDLGVALVDIGAGTTDVAVFVDGSIYQTTVLPVGGNNITKDVAVGLRTPFGIAEELKVRYGCADPGLIAEEVKMDVPTFNREEPERVSRRQLCAIIEARLQELFALVRNEVRRAGSGDLLPAGLVLTGGASELSGLAPWGRAVLDAPVRIGRPSGLFGLTDTIGGPAAAGAVGLLRWASQSADRVPVRSSARRLVRERTRPPVQLNPFSGRLTGWFRAFLP